MDTRIEIYCDDEKFVISLDSITNPIFLNTPIVKSIIGFNFDENKQIHEWYCLNISKEYLKIFIHLIRKEISVFEFDEYLPKVHYDFYGIEIIREQIIEDFFKNYELKFERKEFYINNNKITLNEIIESISTRHDKYHIFLKKENKIYENICILCKEIKNIFDKFIEIIEILSRGSPVDYQLENLLKGQVIKEKFKNINIEYTNDNICFMLPYGIIDNMNNIDLTKFNLLTNITNITASGLNVFYFSENKLDTLKISLLDYKEIYKIIDKIYQDKCEYIKQF